MDEIYIGSFIHSGKIELNYNRMVSIMNLWGIFLADDSQIHPSPLPSLFAHLGFGQLGNINSKPLNFHTICAKQAAIQGRKFTLKNRYSHG